MGLSLNLRKHGEGEVATLTVEGRTTLNVVGREILQQMTAELKALAQNPQLRCVVLTGATDRAFIGGADLKEIGALDQHNAEAFIRTIHDFCQAIRDCPVPIIARMQGFCLGGGLEIAASCDFRIADTSVKVGMPEVRIGVPSVIEAALLPQLIGWGKTRELLMRGNIIGAEEAGRIGLLEQVVEPEQLDPAIKDALDDILKSAPGAVRAQKSLIATWERVAIDAAIEAGIETFIEAYNTDEPGEYVERFFAAQRKRKE